MFDAPFNKLKTFTAYEMYTPLEDYLASGEYPDLTAAFPENIVDANYYFGHLYGLPMMRTYGNGIDCVYYRKDLAKKYNIGTDGQINSYDELQQFFDAILTGEEDVNEYGAVRRDRLERLLFTVCTGYIGSCKEPYCQIESRSVRACASQ